MSLPAGASVAVKNMDSWERPVHAFAHVGLDWDAMQRTRWAQDPRFWLGPLRTLNRISSKVGRPRGGSLNLSAIFDFVRETGVPDGLFSPRSVSVFPWSS